jgi:hypothetical protein
MLRACIPLCSLLMGAAYAADPRPLKEMPQEGEISYGVTVYVDDRKCPKGEIKEVIGGSREKNISRQVRCVPRPPRASTDRSQ